MIEAINTFSVLTTICFKHFTFQFPGGGLITKRQREAPVVKLRSG
jgi:hypothetical protein